MSYTLEIIYESFVNGQKKQAREQIKTYGVKRFMQDFLATHDYTETQKIDILTRYYN